MRLFAKSVLPELPIRTKTTDTSFKSIIACLLLSCLFVDPIVGAFTWIHQKKRNIKREVKRQIIEGIDKDKLVLLKFSKEETKTKLRWEHSREFEYEHKMYDIVETKIVGDTVYYWCWYDHEETMLNRQLEDLANQALGKNPKARPEIILVISFFKSLYCTFSLNGDVSIPRLFYRQDVLFCHIYSQNFIQPPTPPPELSQTNNSNFI